MKIGILSLQGGIIEHIIATKKAAHVLGMNCGIIQVKRKGEFHGLGALIIPGGESTTLGKLIARNGLLGEIKKIKNIFGTCAGAVLLAKKIIGQEEGGQQFLALMDIEADRNAYGPQVDSFEAVLYTRLGTLNAVFIRAPKISPLSKNCEVLAKLKNGEPVAIAQKTKNGFYLATSFHPELSTTKFHEYFLRNLRM